MADNLLELPRELGDGLLLRQATAADAEALAAFNASVFEEEEVGDMVRLILTGQHPTNQASDFLIITDQKADNKIVSSLGLFSQEWSYAGLPFRVGQPEIVATDPAYRRKGLIRIQFDTIHAWSVQRGDLVQAIAGIPWYYRQFGYEMALSLDAWRRFYWTNLTKLNPDEAEKYKIEPATATDIPVLQQLYPIQCTDSMVSAVRPETDWQYAIKLPALTKPLAPNHRSYYVIKTLEGEPVGYAELSPNDKFKRFICREFAVLPGQPLRIVLEFFLRQLHARGIELGKEQPEADLYNSVMFMLGDAHAVYTALGSQLERPGKSYAWYMRVPDVAAFIRHIGPVLEKRLSESVLAGYSGLLKLNFFSSQVAVKFEQGRVVEVAAYEPAYMNDGDGCFPGLTFLHLLFGHRTLAELGYIYPDCFATSERAKVLLEALFPKLPSQLAVLN